jgi:hypothetical protein
MPRHGFAHELVILLGTALAGLGQIDLTPFECDPLALERLGALGSLHSLEA